MNPPSQSEQAKSSEGDMTDGLVEGGTVTLRLINSFAYAHKNPGSAVTWGEM